MGILPDHELLNRGSQLVEPFDVDMIQPASIDVNLDRFFYRARTDNASFVFDPAFSNDTNFEDLIELLDGEGFILRPRDFVLASTFQKIIMPNDLVARFEGKSSLGRLGFLCHITAGFIDPGFEGHITLELKNVTNFDIVLYPGMKIGQIAFEQLSEPVEFPYGDPVYGSHYQGQRGPTLSRSHVNFETINVYEGVEV